MNRIYSGCFVLLCGRIVAARIKGAHGVALPVRAKGAGQGKDRLAFGFLWPSRPVIQIGLMIAAWGVMLAQSNRFCGGLMQQIEKRRDMADRIAGTKCSFDQVYNSGSTWVG